MIRRWTDTALCKLTTPPFFLSKPTQSKSKIRDKETLPEVFTSIFSKFFFPKIICSLLTYLIQVSSYIVNSICSDVGPYVGPSDTNKAVLPVEYSHTT